VLLVNSDQIDKLGFVDHPSVAFRTRSDGFLRLPQHLFSEPCGPSVEILALRHQLGVLQRSVKRPKLNPADRLLWAWLSLIWNGWQARVSIIRPATVIG